MEDWCESYVKPGMNYKELYQRFVSACGCPYHPTVSEGYICTDLEISDTHVCKASTACKKVIQEAASIWKEGHISDWLCDEDREAFKWMASNCIVQ